MNRVEKILKKDQITADDFLYLLSDNSDTYLEEIAQRAHRTTINEFGRTIQVYTPLYLSNYCKNRCVYCGFNQENQITRSILSQEEILKECKEIRELGIRHILLLTGGDRVKSSFSYIKKAVETIIPLFDSVSIEMYAMNENEYRELVELGVDNVTIYQETYSREIYSQVHLYGEKSNYDFRYNAPERAAKAGIRSVNFGVLLGLHDPIEDFYQAALHSYRIAREYPGCDVGISLPRIKEATGSFKTPYLVDDKLLCKMIMAYRIFMPRGAISISTRESRELRDNLLPLGVTKMSAQSKTTVGGHNNTYSEPQFNISDERTVLELEKDLKERGYQPIYKDWVTL